MTGKVLDSSATGALILIFPIALGIIILYAAWPWILLLIGLSIAWKIWENYQWQQWSSKVNPFFNQLIKDNQGCLTPMDLSVKANMSGRSAKRFLDRKATEYGAQRKVYDDKGVVYYFLTVSALGSIFDVSETLENEDLDSSTPSPLSASSPVKQTFQPSSTSEISQLVDLEDQSSSVTSTSAGNFPVAPTVSGESIAREDATQKPSNSEFASTDQNATPLSLIQNDLAKRLDTNASTLGRRKSDPDFAQWSQSKDPDGIAWKYVPETKMFVAIEG